MNQSCHSLCIRIDLFGHGLRLALLSDSACRLLIDVDGVQLGDVAGTVGAAEGGAVTGIVKEPEGLIKTNVETIE